MSSEERHFLAQLTYEQQLQRQFRQQAKPLQRCRQGTHVRPRARKEYRWNPSLGGHIVFPGHAAPLPHKAWCDGPEHCPWCLICLPGFQLLRRKSHVTRPGPSHSLLRKPLPRGPVIPGERSPTNPKGHWDGLTFTLHSPLFRIATETNPGLCLLRTFLDWISRGGKTDPKFELLPPTGCDARLGTGKGQLRASLYLSLRPDCACHVACCLLHAVPDMMGCTLKLQESQTQPFP